MKIEAKYTRDLINYYKQQLCNAGVVCTSREHEIYLCQRSIEQLKEIERLAFIGKVIEESDILICKYDKYNQLKPKTMSLYEVVKEYESSFEIDKFKEYDPISFELYCVEIENIPYYNNLAVDEYDDVYDKYKEFVKTKYNRQID